MKRFDYEIPEVEPYINWLYFFYAWGLSGKPKAEKDRLQGEALEMLHSWYGKYQTHALLGIFEANSEDDDIWVGNMRFPMLRQQHPASPGEPNLCLADYLRSRNCGIVDQLGVFCTTVDGIILESYRHDAYLGMVAQTLCDRLAEATAEKLTQEEYSGIRPAVGYPSLPDTSANFLIDQLLDMGKVGIRLTETGMMTPHASVSGLMFAHPKARYFELGKIGDDQLCDYARRRGIPKEMMRKFLQSSLLKR